MSKSKIVVIIIYLSLILSSGYNLFSYKKPYKMSAGITTHLSTLLKTSIEISNGSDQDWKNLNIILEKNYVLHVDELKKKTSYNAQLWEFIPMDYKPMNSSRIRIWEEQTRSDIVKILENIKVFDLELYIEGGYHHQKLQNN